MKPTVTQWELELNILDQMQCLLVTLLEDIISTPQELRLLKMRDSNDQICLQYQHKQYIYIYLYIIFINVFILNDYSIYSIFQSQIYIQKSILNRYQFTKQIQNITIKKSKNIVYGVLRWKTYITILTNRYNLKRKQQNQIISINQISKIKQKLQKIYQLIYRIQKKNFISKNNKIKYYYTVQQNYVQSNNRDVLVQQIRIPQISDQRKDENRKKLNISSSWNQSINDIDKSHEPMLLKENETLRNLVNNLQQQLKFIRQKEKISKLDQQQIEEAEEDREQSSRSLSQEIDRLKKQLVNEREQYNKTIMDLERKLLEKEELLNHSKNHSIDRKKDEFTIQTLQEEMSKLLIENDKLNMIIEQQIRKNKILISELNQDKTNPYPFAHENRDDYEIQQDEYKNIVQKLQQENSCLKEHLSHLERLLEEQQKYVNNLELKSEDIIVKNGEITQLFQDSKQEFNCMKDNYEKELSQKQSTIQKLQYEYDQLINNSNISQQQIHEQESKVKDLKHIVDSQKAQLESINEKAKNLQQQLQQLNINLQKSNQQRDRSKREIAQLQEQIDNLKRMTEGQKKDMEKLSFDNEQLILFNQKRKDEFDFLFNDLEQSQNEILNLLNQLHELQSDKEQNEQRIKQLEIQILSNRLQYKF